jgi:hypothetical protein
MNIFNFPIDEGDKAFRTVSIPYSIDQKNLKHLVRFIKILETDKDDIKYSYNVDLVCKEMKNNEKFIFTKMG